MEHKWVELARQRLQTGDADAPAAAPDSSAEAPADRSGMMCSGEQDVLLWPLAAADLAAVAAIEQRFADAQRRLPGAEPGQRRCGFSLLDNGRSD